MSPALQNLHQLTRLGKAHAPALLAQADDPHAELLTMIWGPQFDREYALDWWARLSRQRPVEAMPMLPELLSAAERFDALAVRQQQLLRRLVLRHRSGQMVAMSE